MGRCIVLGVEVGVVKVGVVVVNIGVGLGVRVIVGVEVRVGVGLGLRVCARGWVRVVERGVGQVGVRD